jgi:hypothetical protein
MEDEGRGGQELVRTESLDGLLDAAEGRFHRWSIVGGGHLVLVVVVVVVVVEVRGYGFLSSPCSSK